MIKFEDVSKIYNKLSVVNHLNLLIELGESVAIMGPNGSGKSTMIKSILGLVKPEKGNIFVNNENVKNSDNYRYNIGYMPQIARYPENLTPREIINLILKIRNQQSDKFPESLIYDFELIQHLDKKMNSLSGGSRQKVSVVLTFMFNPQILILDEPTSGLDPYMALKFIEMVKERNNSGTTIILVSHTLAEINEISNRIVYLFEGNKLIDDSIENIKNSVNQSDLNLAILKKIQESKNAI